MTGIQQPVFIIGTGRTGSKIYLHALRQSRSLHVSHEMKVLRPFQPDLASLLPGYLPLDDGDSVREFANELFNGQLKGRFYQEQSNDARGKFVEETVSRLPSHGCPDLPQVVETLLRIDARLHEKERFGAKFPVHLRYVSKLEEWFPSAKLVHLTRDPRAATASHLKAQAERVSELSPVKVPNAVSKPLLLVQKAYDYHLAARLHRRKEGEDHYDLFRFEDLIRRPEETLRRLCGFVGVEFQEEMLSPPMVASSYGGGRRGEGFDEATLERWREHLSPLAQKIVEVTCRRPARTLGYAI